MRTPTVSSRDSMLTKTKSRPEKRQRLDSDSENSNCDDSSDEEAEDIVKELTQDLEEAESEEERRTQGADESEERDETADNRAPAARQSAQKVCESAAGAGEANRGKKRPREEKAPAALEEHAAGAAEDLTQIEELPLQMMLVMLVQFERDSSTKGGPLHDSRFDPVAEGRF